MCLSTSTVLCPSLNQPTASKGCVHTTKDDIRMTHLQTESPIIMEMSAALGFPLRSTQDSPRNKLNQQ